MLLHRNMIDSGGRDIQSNHTQRIKSNLSWQLATHLKARNSDGLKLLSSSLSCSRPISRARFSALAVRTGIRLAGVRGDVDLAVGELENCERCGRKKVDKKNRRP